MSHREDWQRLYRPMIEAALATGPGFETIEDVERAIAKGAYQVFPGKKSCVITEVLTHSSGRKSLHLVHTAGDLQELIAVFEPSLIEFARFMGCDQLLGSGRHGWERLGRAHGWRFAWTTLVKDIPPQ
jgi:hypothetical protein